MARPLPPDATITWATGSVAVSGNTTLVSAPGANTQLRVVHLSFSHASATADVLTIKFGSLAKMTFRVASDGATIFIPELNDEHPLDIGENNALKLNKTAAVTTYYTVGYYTDAV